MSDNDPVSTETASKALLELLIRVESLEQLLLKKGIFTNDEYIGEVKRAADTAAQRILAEISSKNQSKEG